MTPFSAYSMGVMTGFNDKEGSGSWNIGVGLYVNTTFRELRAELGDGETTTETNPEDLIVETDKEGVMIIVSSTW